MPVPAPFIRSSTRVLFKFHLARTLGIAVRGIRRMFTSGLALSTAGALPSDARPQPLNGPPRVLIIDAHSPRPELDSGSVRLVALIRLFARYEMAPALLVDDFDPIPVSAPLVPTDTVRDARSAMAWIRRHADTLDLVVIARHTVAHHWLPMIRAVLPGVPVVFDTVDLHFVREARQAKHHRSIVLSYLAKLTRHRELALATAADATWVVSEPERDRLLELQPASRVACISNIVDPIFDSPGMSERRDFIFVGNFRHEPNIDAVRWLLTLWPKLHHRCPDARLRLIGPYLPTQLAERLSSLPGVEVAGHAPDLTEHLVAARVMLAPLRFGAGVKGKLNAAFAHGLPVVGTSCATEGMQFDNDKGVLVADDENEFIDAAHRLYLDEPLWVSVRTVALNSVERHFSSRAVGSRLIASLRDLGIAMEPA